MKKPLIIFISLIVLIALFMFLRPQDTVKLPIGGRNDSQLGSQNVPGDTNVKRFTDKGRNDALKSSKNGTNTTGTGVAGVKATKPKPTPKPLPYPRISINYSMKTTRSIGNNKLDVNSTFVIVTLDIRNYGYKYFDAHPSRFRIGKTGEVGPLMNISTGKIIDAVIPNNSRAKGNIIFLLGKKVNQGKLAYFPINESENYYILYKTLKQSDMEDVGIREVTDDEYW